MNDTNRSDDYATGIAELDRDEIEIPNEAITLDDGIVHFSFDIEWLPGGDFIVKALSGTLEDGSPRVVHAVYNDRDAMLAWLYALVSGEGAPTTVAILEDHLAMGHGLWAHQVAIGEGSWLRGVARLERVQAVSSIPERNDIQEAGRIIGLLWPESAQ